MKKIATGLLIVGLFAANSYAETSGEDPRTKVLNFEAAERGEANNLTAAWDGHSDYYRGYEKSPIIIDPVVLQRKYPELADRPGMHIRAECGTDGFCNSEGTPMHTDAQSQNVVAGKQRSSLKALNLGVHDEIKKTTMAIYQPLRIMDQDFANDEIARDDYLNLFKTLRGVAILTLNFLDKTVASGLAATKQQADFNTQNQISKQISWASSRLANPQRAAMYIDVDEKVEACLAYDVVGKDADGVEGKRLRRMDKERCEAETVCGPVPEAGEADEHKLGNGLYRWCVCCAEQSAILNDPTPLTGDKYHGEKMTYSLVDKAFYGQRGPNDDGSDNYYHKNPAAEYLNEVVRSFREMYGDVKVKGDGTEIRTEYIFPNLSPALKVKFFREGCSAVTGVGSPTCHETYCEAPTTLACPLTQTKVTTGICPAIIRILNTWPLTAEEAVGIHGEDNKRKAQDLWINASFGKILTARDFQNMLNLVGRVEGYNGEWPGDNQWPEGKLGRWLDSFCDASAVAGFKRFHHRMQSVTLDHLTMNQHITPQEKNMLMNLMSRVSEYLSLAEMDVNAAYVSEMALTGLSVEVDRQKQAEMAAGARAALNEHNSVSQTSGFQVWGQSGTNFCKNGNCVPFLSPGLDE